MASSPEARSGIAPGSETGAPRFGACDEECSCAETRRAVSRRRRAIVTTTSRRRRPASVWIAIVALSVVVAVQVTLALLFARSGEVGWGMYAFAGLLWALLVGGLVRGARLAWLWGRYLPLLLGVLMTAAIVAGFARHELGSTTVAWTLAGIALPLFVAGLALGRPSAFAWFDLVCPVCSHRTGLGADFLFRQARCRKCDNVW